MNDGYSTDSKQKVSGFFTAAELEEIQEVN